MAQAQATLGGGCFWCLDAVFRRLDGVTQVVSGYAGGTLAHPTYAQVCGGRTGHAEVVQITFDDSVLGYGDLLAVFFAIHDPTTPDRQGADLGPQYRSIILTHDAGQAAVAAAELCAQAESGRWSAPLVTEVRPLTQFWPAEAYHQDYFAHHPEAGYCRAVIAPKVAKFRQHFAERLRPA
jgi:peptide-methionine (S)-S-oxide reductase